ncbi:MAG: isoleucine--tRNA ligase [Planctomycetota bacterium]
MSEKTEAAAKQQKVKGKSFKDTLNLPKTDFPMRAGLVKNEPASLERWTNARVYDRLRESRKGSPRWVFHDGPPYANGSLHLGHLLNKTLKDFVVRSRGMMGFDVPFVPGWDCHGLPIEHKVMEKLVESGKAAKLKDMAPDEARMFVRKVCASHAEKNVGVQRTQMERLLTVADYENPYLTMHPAYEGAVLEVLAELVEKGLVFRALKPVHWSIANETALADAELEYQDREDLSVYVDFEAADAGAVYDAFGVDEDARGATPSFMIWTTTPWTLPANLAIAVKRDFRYALVRIDGNITVLAEKLIGPVTDAAKSEDVEVLALVEGEKLVGLKYRHPFLEIPAEATAAVWSIVEADYVTLEDGTGLVHTAPGHGTEDYQTGLRVGLPTYCPVRGDGTYDDTTPEWLRGKSIWKANQEIADRIRESGHLFYGHKFDHSYPHDWRSKTPVIFRCTEQWFVGVDTPFSLDGDAGNGSLRERSLGFAADEEKLSFLPTWGRNRLRGMLESRPDWCISRQRAWGLPIPAFTTPDGETFMTKAVTLAIAARFREVGSDAWFTEPADSLLKHYKPELDDEAPAGVHDGSIKIGQLTKGADILDVWFESGSSWNAVMRERSDGEDFPVSVYLEGSDQHRGWFQTSMLPAIGVTGRPPYDALFTHGFCVDKNGKKLSKSSGDTLENLYDQYGADVLRWWVSGTPYEGDVKVDREFFDLAGEAYRKIRNTLRFMLGNLQDFEVGTHCVDLELISPTSIDAWALAEFDRVAKTVTDAYERFDFRTAQQTLYGFCNDAMSSVYLAAIKDRLYCDKADGERRRATQSALYDICDGLCRLLAPIVPHTADEAWRLLPGKTVEDCLHLEEFINAFGVQADERWKNVMAVRHVAQKALEEAKADGIENAMDAGLVFGDAEGVLGAFDTDDLADLCGVSRARVEASGDGVTVEDLREQPRCERSRKRHESVRERSDGSLLCDRDADAIGVA